MNIKKAKGITLIALIITIVILLILAVVAINAVNEGSLFAHANNAATAYSEAAEEENSIISSYLALLEGNGSENQTSSGLIVEGQVWTNVSLNLPAADPQLGENGIQF